MNLENRYLSRDGIRCDILQLVKAEPEWAANRIQAGEKAEAALTEKEAELAELREKVRELLKFLEYGATNFGPAHKVWDIVAELKVAIWNQERNLRAAAKGDGLPEAKAMKSFEALSSDKELDKIVRGE